MSQSDYPDSFGLLGDEAGLQFPLSALEIISGSRRVLAADVATAFLITLNKSVETFFQHNIQSRLVVINKVPFRKVQFIIGKESERLNCDTINCP